ncbi:uncharacterized protein OCT59_014059 [Rhizophagus irregularis]|uniref:uncharacterized protein n=1 Tax=Rhizophagus irregularis TaxID=588596 RepID=UPI0033237DE5|nr:hypothetical protein OCT59_014059 [Rhizophagus irregularis]
MGVVFITTLEQLLIWGAYDLSAERFKMEDVIRHIKKLMSDVDKDHINIKAFIFDSAGEYAAAQYVILCYCAIIITINF